MKKSKTGILDWTLLLIVVVLVILGLIMQYSASSYKLKLVIKQAEYAGIGLALVVGMSFIPPKFYYKISIPAYLFALLLTVLAGLAGKSVNGARRWFEIGTVTFQPSELLKAGVVISVAAVVLKFYYQMNQCEYYSLKEHIKQFRTIDHLAYVKEHTGYYLQLLLIIAAAGAVTVFNKDMGTGVIIFVIGYCMMMVMSPRIGWLLGLLAAGLVALGVLVAAFPYRMGRITAWLYPDENMDNLAYQGKQAIYAIGSGGWLGRGLGKSIQKGSIPEAHTDMIFSILCEELGIIGGIAVIVLFILLIVRLKKNYDQTTDIFGKMIIAGVSAHIWSQAFINMGVLTGLLPNTGVPLPFISYGGTSLLCLLIEIGLVMAVRKNRPVILQKTEPGLIREQK